MQNLSLTNPSWIKAKGILFLLLGILSSVLLFLEQPTPKVGLLLIVAIWSFCRFYYFAFYVIERYIDSDYRFSGILSFLRYLLWRKKSIEDSLSGGISRGLVEGPNIETGGTYSTSEWAALLHRRHRVIADGWRLRPRAICMWATRAPSGRRGSALAMPAAH